MIQVWTMFGLGGERPTDDPMGPIMKLFDDNGYIGVVATNCEQTYHRYLRPGEEVTICSEMGDVVGPKQTGLGEGWFINQHIIWRVGDEDVAEMNWRILKFKPLDRVCEASMPEDLDAAAMMRPSESKDTKFFWDGVKAHELRIQKRPDGSLQHPPVPAIWQDHAKRRPTTWSPAVRARCSASWCITHQKCLAAHCRSSSRSCSWRKACGCSVSCAMSTPPPCRLECRSGQRISTSPPMISGRSGRCTHGSRTA